ncbi:IS630 family transposase [Myxococcus vastator]|uniref:IS630 family transposase n=1 Tax=Myxococcus vastator TaxID=2709664 RepID=UPI0013D6CAD5|nr:IS630 family transposase [Myxococcus vastator]
MAKNRQARRRYLDKSAELKPSHLDFIDETAATLTMARRYGRARRGQRTRGYVPMGRRQVLTMMGDLTLQGMGPVLTFEGATNSERFETYVREGLLPILQPHDVVVLDNLSAHHRPAVEALIRSRKAQLLFLPPYSPDLNPIESCWLSEPARLATLRLRNHPTPGSHETGTTATQERPGIFGSSARAVLAQPGRNEHLQDQDVARNEKRS